MRKIPTLFVRDWDGDRRYVLDQVTPGCEWVIKGDGVPTRKYDGTCMLLDSAGRWWARREVKAGKPVPAGFVSLETDAETGKMIGWEPAAQSSFARWHAEVIARPGRYAPGTYELIGAKVNGNPEEVIGHQLIPHGIDVLSGAPRDFAGLAAWLHAHPYEGIVWHHPHGRLLGGPVVSMVKIKKRDFRAQAGEATGGLSGARSAPPSAG